MDFPPSGHQTKAGDVFHGRTRPSMNTNFLLQKTHIGEGMKFVFADTSPHKTFGVSPRRAEEGAREVTMNWKEQRPDAKTPPGPDYRAMNKQATSRGLTSCTGQQDFCKAHFIPLKQGLVPQASGPVMPPSFVYGRPSSHKTMEEVRMSGCPRCEGGKEHWMYDRAFALACICPVILRKDAYIDIGTLIQGAFAEDWSRSLRDKDFTQASRHTTPRDTKASLGHTLGAQERLLRIHQQPTEPFKMPRFKTVKRKTLTRRSTST